VDDYRKCEEQYKYPCYIKVRYMTFIMIYGPSGIGKESIGRELARRNGWKLFQQHLAFDISCAVIGFSNDGFEKYQRKICLDAFDTFYGNGTDVVVFTFCYVPPFSHYFIEGLFDFLEQKGITANFIRISCDIEKHIVRVTSEGRKNTNKIQTKESLQDYLQRFDFSVDIPGVKTLDLESSNLSVVESAIEIEHYLTSQL